MKRHVTLLTIGLSLIAGGCTCSSEPPAFPPTAAQQPSTDSEKQKHEMPVIAAHPVADTAPAADRQPDGERPPLKSRWGRSLSEQLDRIDGGTNQERDLIRETLRKNDAELDRSFKNLPGRIEAANNTHDGPRRISIPAP